MVSKYKKGLGQGWRNESSRHSLSAHGIKTGCKVDYAKDYTVLKGAGLVGAGAVGAGVVDVGGYVAGQTGVVASDVPSILADVVGVSLANIAKTIPYVVIGGVTYEGIKGLHKLASLYYDKKLSREALERKIKASGGRPVVVTKEEIGESIPEGTHVVSVRGRDKAVFQYAKQDISNRQGI
jgi:hypothetical protein